MLAYAREHPALHETPKHWMTVDDFPLTGSGKIQKCVLRQTWERQAPPPPVGLPRRLTSRCDGVG